jgi:ribosomal protein L5
MRPEMQKVDLPDQAASTPTCSRDARAPRLRQRHGRAAVEKIVLNMGVGEAREDAKLLEKASRDLAN